MFQHDLFCLDTENDSQDTLTNEVYKDLLKKFLNNEILPGTILDRKNLAKEMDVSIAPLREALARLTMEGFIETLPRRGTIAKTFSRKDIYGSLILREAIEVQAVRMYCGKPIRDHLEALTAAAKEVDAQDYDMADHWKWDVHLHLQLINLTDCDALVSEFRRIMKIAIFYHVNTFLPVDDLKERLSHVELINTLSEENPDQAGKALSGII